MQNMLQNKDLPVYLDYAATTPVDMRVIQKMQNFLGAAEGGFGNPASSHYYGRIAARAVENARQQAAELIGADAAEIIWTSGATEANNLALKGAAHYYKNKGKHIVTCLTEHDAVIGPCRRLEKEGFEVTYLQPAKNGLLALGAVQAALRPDTILVSLMHVNNETGVMHPISEIGEFLKSKNILFHVDAAQSVGKVPIDLQTLPVDLLSFSAHKLYGPKGAGALYIRQKPRVYLIAEIEGGGQEHGIRSGTLATHQIVGMGEACAIAKTELPQEIPKLTQMRNKLWKGLSKLPDVFLNGDEIHRVPGILNVAFAGIDSTLLIPALNKLAVSVGSACHNSMTKASRVLTALGLSEHLAQSSIRFSIGRFTTEAEIDFTIELVSQAVTVLRS